MLSRGGAAFAVFRLPSTLLLCSVVLGKVAVVPVSAATSVLAQTVQNTVWRCAGAGAVPRQGLHARRVPTTSVLGWRACRLATTGVLVQTVQNCLEKHICSSWTRFACLSCGNDRCFGPDSAEHCLEIHRCSSRTGCPCPLLWRLVLMARLRSIPVEIPQVPFLDKLFMPVVVSGADGQTVQYTVEVPQLPFFAVVSCRAAQLQYVSGSSSWTRSCLHFVVHAKGYGPDSATRELHVQFLDKVDMPSWCFDRCRVQPAVFQPSSSHRCESSRALGVALTPGVELPGVRPPVVHKLVASQAHAFRILRVWTDTCVNASPTTTTTTTIIQSGEAPF